MERRTIVPVTTDPAVAHHIMEAFKRQKQVVSLKEMPYTEGQEIELIIKFYNGLPVKGIFDNQAALNEAVKEYLTSDMLGVTSIHIGYRSKSRVQSLTSGGHLSFLKGLTN